MTTANDFPAVSTMCSKCPTFKETSGVCMKIKCCLAYQRRGHEQRVADDARISAEKGREGKATG